jgi:hypothetical protein
LVKENASASETATQNAMHHHESRSRGGRARLRRDEIAALERLGAVA